MVQTKRSRKSRDFSTVHPAAAAIDIGATIHVAAVGPDRDMEPVRTFRTFTDDLHRLADWFACCGIKTVVMESTGVYWIPVFEILEQRGFEVMVVNARDAKHVPGRKTDALSDADHRRVGEVLTFITNMEHAGDIIEKNLLGIATKKLRRGVSFSKAGEAELLAMIDRLLANLRMAASLFMTADERAARLLVGEKEIFRSLESEATAAHFERLRARRTDTVETSTMHLDVLRDLKNVNTHFVAAAAYPVLESKGELLASRLRQDGDASA